MYKGPLKIGAYKGDATYTYEIVENDTILQGDFRVQRSNLQELLEQQDYSFLFKGAFVDGIAHGPWTFQFGDFKSKSKSEVIDYQYRVLVSGTQEVAKGNIELGKPDGKWTIVLEEIEDSEISKTLFKSVLSFENGIPQQNFSINNEKYTLVGRFLRNGLAHDEWSLFPVNGMDQTESWNFKDGLLQSIKINTDGNVKMIPVYKNLRGTTKTVNLDEGYLRALEMQFSEGDLELFLNEGLPRLLEQNTAQYQKIDAILSEVGKADFLPEFKVKVPYYPLDSVEISAIDSIAYYSKKATEMSSAIRTNSQLNILKLSDKKTLFRYNTVQKITSVYLKPLQEIIAFDSLSILERTTREQLFTHLFPKGIPENTLPIEMSMDSTVTTASYTFPNTEEIRPQSGELTTIEAIARRAYGGILDITSEVEETLAQENRQNELVMLEEEIISGHDALVAFVDSVGTSIPAKYSTALQQLKTFAGTTLHAYSNIKSAQSKLEFARTTVSCLQELLALAQTVVQMPERWNTIQEAYTDRIWNPFTATLMDEEVKKRITSAYIKILEPYFLKEIEHHLTCETVKELDSNINGSFTNISGLRDMETRKIERKLRRENDPKVVLQLLNVQNLTN